jgi:ABC-2 type transport system permease protein
MKIRKYSAISKIEFKQGFQYFFDFLLSAFFIVVILFVFSNLWRTIYGTKATIDGFSIGMMIWYLAFTEAVTMGMGWRSLFETVSDEVKNGTVSNYLTKPLSYVGWHMSKGFSKFVITFVTVLFISSVLCLLLVGPISFSYFQIIPLIIITLMTFILSFFIGMSLSLLAFWLEDVTALYWILQKGLFILGGMLIPLDVYPAAISKYLTYLPFAFIVYGPGKYFVTGDISVFTHTLIGQIFWVSICAGIMILIYKLAIGRLNIHGG